MGYNFWLRLHSHIQRSSIPQREVSAVSDIDSEQRPKDIPDESQLDQSIQVNVYNTFQFHHIIITHYTWGE